MLERRTALWMLIALALCACANSRRAKSSETHFLARCSDDACGPGLQCVCGVCSQPCVDEGACGELAAQADCLVPAAEDCSEVALCDATCERDQDCAPLSAEHTCEAGRCRAPSAPADGSCEVDGVTFADGESFPNRDGCNTCRCADGILACTMNACPRAVGCEYGGATYQDGENFPAVDGCNQCYCEGGSVFCTERGCSACAAGECRSGDACVPDGAPDPSGDCNSCTCRGGSLECTTIACSPVIDPPPCEPGSCEYYGVCYPPGTGTEDGCCGCATELQQQAGWGSGCITPGTCPGRPDIGSRCGDMTMGCAMGLTCLTTIFGERPICIRACNYGCPTGTECVEQVPGYDGSVIEHVCLRTCTTQADCEFPDASGSAGECDMVPGLDRSYCF